MSTATPTATLPSSHQKTIVGGLGTLAVAVLTIATVFNAVNWSAAQTALVTAEAAAVAGLVTALVAHLARQVAAALAQVGERVPDPQVMIRRSLQPGACQ